MRNDDAEIKQLALDAAAAPERLDRWLGLARAHARRGETVAAVAAIRRGLAAGPTDALLRRELVACAPQLAAPWPSPDGAGGHASLAATGSRRGKIHRRFVHDAPLGPPIVLAGGRVLRAGDEVVEVIDVEAERVERRRIPGLRLGALRLLPDGRVLGRASAGLVIVDLDVGLATLLDKEAAPGERRGIWVGPSGGIAIGRGPSVATFGPKGEPAQTRALAARKCRRAALLGGGEAVHERRASGFAGDPRSELWVEVQEPLLVVENRGREPEEVVRYATSVEWWPEGHAPSRDALDGDAERIVQLVAGPAGEPIVLVQTSWAELEREAAFMGGGVVTLPRGADPTAVAWDAPRRRVAIAGGGELAVHALGGGRAALPVETRAVAFDAEGHLFALAESRDGARVLAIDLEVRAVAGPPVPGAEGVVIGAGLTLAHGERILYALA